MNRIPVDQSALTFHVVSVGPHLDDNKQQKVTDEGVPVWSIQCLHMPEQVGDYVPKGQVEAVRVPARTEPKVDKFSEVKFVNLVARPWSMNGRSGVSLSADAVADAKTGALPAIDGGK